MVFEDDIDSIISQKSAKLSRDELAKRGEELACKHISKLEYRIIERNFRFGRVGEIDIVAYDGDCLVFGNETHGLPETLIAAHPQRSVRIPQAAGERCLNLSTAAGIALFEALRQTNSRST